MTQQTQHDPGEILPSLAGKLLLVADGLTPEEAEQLRVMKPEGGTAELSRSLQTKLAQGAQELTAEEQAQLRLLVQGARTGTAAGAESDTEGYLLAQFNDGQGNKGRPQPVTGTAGGGALPTPISVVEYFAQGVQVLPILRDRIPI